MRMWFGVMWHWMVDEWAVLVTVIGIVVGVFMVDDWFVSSIVLSIQVLRKIIVVPCKFVLITLI